MRELSWKKLPVAKRIFQVALDIDGKRAWAFAAIAFTADEAISEAIAFLDTKGPHHIKREQLTATMPMKDDAFRKP